MKNRVRILFQDYHAIEASGEIPLQENWDLKRKEKISYLTHKTGFEAADEAFHIFNAPEEILSVEQKMILNAYDGPSLSVGDVVEVYPEKGTPKAYLCASIGWQEALIEQKKSFPKPPRGIPMAVNDPAPPPRRTIDVAVLKSYNPIKEPIVKYKGTSCSVEVNLYKDGKSICLRLKDKSDGTPITMATVNVPEINGVLPQNHVLIKNYSESRAKSPDTYSLIDSLEKAGIGSTKSAYEISEYGAEVFEMEITDPWILSRAEELRKEVILKENSKSKETKQNISTKKIEVNDPEM